MDITWGYEPSVACSIRASCASWDWYIGSTQGCDPWRLSSTLRSRPICSMSPSNNSQFATLSQWRFQCNSRLRQNQSSSFFRSLSFQAHLVLIWWSHHEDPHKEDACWKELPAILLSEWHGQRDDRLHWCAEQHSWLSHTFLLSRSWTRILVLCC